MSEHQSLPAPEASTEVRVAIVGVGNCASSLVQGVEYYYNADDTSTVPGLMHVRFGPYHVRDVKFVAAFDVDAKKVGFDLSDAIFASENNTIKIADVAPTNVIVQRGPTLDGIGKYYADTIELSDAEPVDVVQALKEAKVDVLGLRLFGGVGCCPFRGDELVEPLDLALAGLEPELMQLAGVAVEGTAGPRHRLAQAFPAFLDLAAPAFQDAHPRFGRGAVEERQVHPETVVGVVVWAGVGHQLAESTATLVGQLVNASCSPHRGARWGGILGDQPVGLHASQRRV